MLILQLPKRNDRAFNKMDGGIVKDNPIKKEFSSSSQVLQTVNDRLMKKSIVSKGDDTYKKYSTDVEAKQKFQTAQSSAL